MRQIYLRVYSCTWLQRRVSSLTVGITAYKYGLFYKWVLQHKQFIPVVQVGTTENVAVLQEGITAYKHGLSYKWVLQHQ